VVEVLDQKHSRYRDREEMWRRYWDFYVGGEQLRRNAGLYMVRRQKEPNDVYSERLGRVFYENYLGSAIDWYAATLFRSRPGLAFDTEDASAREFYGQFVEDCDCRQTHLLDLTRRAFIETLVFGESFVLVDFPRVEGEVANRAEEDALGKSRAYLVPYSPLDLINWKQDRNGAYEWVVLKSRQTFQESFDKSGLVTEERWAYYDREKFKIFSRKGAAGGPSDGTPVGGGVEVVAEGRHGLAEVGRVPLIRMGVSDGLWLANKAGSIAQEHFNKSNALSWALHMGLFAMPVIYSEREWQQIVGEAYYIQLGPEDRFGWTEPEGKVFEIAAQNLDRLKDEIFRVSFLMTQAGGREARNLGQSGISKQRDFAVTHEVLRGYGRLVKDFLKGVLRSVADARRDEVRVEVTGLDHFDKPEFGDEIDSARGIRELGIGSERLEKEAHKRVALKYLEGMGQETKDAVLAEIDGR